MLASDLNQTKATLRCVRTRIIARDRPRLAGFLEEPKEGKSILWRVKQAGKAAGFSTRRSWVQIPYALLLLTWGIGPVRSGRFPVTEEITGSNPVCPAQLRTWPNGLGAVLLKQSMRVRFLPSAP